MRALLENWRYSISFEWHCLDKGALVFYALLPLPFVFLALLVYSVHEAHEHAYSQAVVVQARDADIQCLAENVYHEARGEPLDGQYAVAEVTMNRVGSTLFPKSVCDVVHEKALGSATAALRRRILMDRARAAAAAARRRMATSP